MKTSTSYSRIQQQLPNIANQLVEALLNKIKKNNKSNSSCDPNDWSWYYDWAQRISNPSVSFYQAVDDTKASAVKKTEISTEQIVYDFFAQEDLFVNVVAQVGRIKVSEKFPSFKDEDFFVPEEIVNAYKPKGILQLNSQYDYPRVFIYKEKKDGKAIHECVVWGGLKDKNNDIFVIATAPSDTSCFTYKPVGNTLYAQSFFSTSSGICAEDFLTTKKIKLGKNTFETVSPFEVNSLLKNHSQWIEDPKSILSVVLGALRNSSSFMMIGKVPESDRLEQIPTDTDIIYIDSVKPIDNFLKKKLKIK